MALGLTPRHPHGRLPHGARAPGPLTSPWGWGFVLLLLLQQTPVFIHRKPVVSGLSPEIASLQAYETAEVLWCSGRLYYRPTELTQVCSGQSRSASA